MATSKSTSSSAAVIAGKNCIYCGADLTGLTAQDVCSQCGKPAGYSLLGDHLRDVESTWLRQVVLGIDVITGSIVLLLVMRVLSLISIIDSKLVTVEMTLIRVNGNHTGWLAFTVGIFLITRPETSGSMIARRRTVANLLLAACVVFLAIELTPERLVLQYAKMPGLMSAIGLSSLALLLSQSLLWLHLRRSIIDRTPRREVGRKLNSFFWISMVLFALFSDGSVRLVSRYLADSSSAMLALKLGGCGVMMLYHAVAIYLLIATRKAIRRTVGYWDN